MRKACGIGWFLLASLSVDPLGAVTQNYDVVVTSAFGPHSNLFRAGDRLLISYTLDPLAVDANSDPHSGAFPEAVLSLTISFPNRGIFAFAGPSGSASTFDNFLISGQWSDGIFIFGGPISSASLLGGDIISFLEVDFGTGLLTPPAEPSLFSSDALPLFKLPIIKDEAVLFLGTRRGFTQVDFAAAPSSTPASCNGRVATIVGTRGADRIRGTERDDVIVGLAGTDVIYGLGGKDIICGGDGRDIIYGGSGDDRLFGGKGRDAVFGDGGNDWLFGQEDDDDLHGDFGSDVLDGGSGNDICRGGADSTEDVASTSCDHVSDVP